MAVWFHLVANVSGLRNRIHAVGTISRGQRAEAHLPLEFIYSLLDLRTVLDSGRISGVIAGVRVAAGHHRQEQSGCSRPPAAP
jgi:hypothetical protein